MRQWNPMWEENAQRDQRVVDRGGNLMLPQPDGRGVGIPIPCSGLQGEDTVPLMGM